MRSIAAILIITISTCFHCSFAQNLQLPARQTGAYNGQQVIDVIRSLPLAEREDSIFAQIATGNVPDFQRNLVTVTINENITGIPTDITYYVLPDYLAIGHDTNYFLCPMTPLLGQRICNITECMLPTRKMVNEIWNAATVKLSPSTQTPGPEMTTVTYFETHNNTVWAQRSAVLATNPLGELVGGDKKDVIISNQIWETGSQWVVIYGWHQLNGSPIQPLYNGHIDEYADYSHGIRLVQKMAFTPTDTINIDEALMDNALDHLFSDEGVIMIPYYTVPGETVERPEALAVRSFGADGVEVLLSPVANAVGYKLQYSSDAINFTDVMNSAQTSFTYSGIPSDAISYFRIVTQGTSMESAPSELLAINPNSSGDEILIVNGFDREVSGNTHDFVIEHGTSIYNCGRSFISATNEAVIDGLLDLESLNIVDYILGEESTADETFSDSEQLLVKAFLDGGGNLFVSGAEIGWDLDHLGSTSDKDFYNNYLKSQYANDAPGGIANTYFNVEAVTGSIFDAVQPFSFDNGVGSTYTVEYPDVMDAFSGGQNCLLYSGFTNQFAGVYYKGMFPQGNQVGSVVNLGFPFETIMEAQARDELMCTILEYFETPVSVHNYEPINQFRIFPNPASDYIMLENLDGHYSISDMYGNSLQSGICKEKERIDISAFPVGIYFIRNQNGIARKLVKR